MGQSHNDATILAAGLMATGDLAYVWDLVQDRIAWAGSVETVFDPGVLEAPSSSETFHAWINTSDISRRLTSLKHHLVDGGLLDCEYRIKTTDENERWIHERGRAESDENGRPVRLCGTLRIVANRQELETQLQQRANYDDLTGHLNKARLREALQHSMDYNARFDIEGAYLAIGIDKLSMINDAYGHEAADAVIVGVGQVMERCLRVIDVIGRIGGDRFGLVLGNCAKDGPQIAADKILEALRANPIDTPSGPVHITVSIGGVSFPRVAKTAHDAMTCAESALQEAKARGRNCYVPFEMTPSQRDKQRRDIDLGQRLLKALDEDRFALAYQPVVSRRAQDVSHYETLLRLYDEKGDLVPAAEFVPIAEALGLIRLLDLRAVDIAVEDLMGHPNVRLALNVSSLTIADRSWLRRLSGLVKGRRDIASRLTIEITETTAMEDLAASAQFVAELREMGCRVALDDFGSGYTSFQHMKAMSLDVVKIDGSFVKDVATSPENQLFISTLLGLARGFGLETVAECVETAEEAQILIDKGVDYLQGWYYGRPELEPAWRTNCRPRRAVGSR